jgi:gas vesicle protein
MKEQSKVIVAAIIGVAAGAVLGMLLAPEKGEENRKKIASLAKDIIDSATDLAIQATRGNKEDQSHENPETTLGV